MSTAESAVDTQAAAFFVIVEDSSTRRSTCSSLSVNSSHCSLRILVSNHPSDTPHFRNSQVQQSVLEQQHRRLCNPSLQSTKSHSALQKQPSPAECTLAASPPSVQSKCLINQVTLRTSAAAKSRRVCFSSTTAVCADQPNETLPLSNPQVYKTFNSSIVTRSTLHKASCDYPQRAVNCPSIPCD